MAKKAGKFFALAALVGAAAGAYYYYKSKEASLDDDFDDFDDFEDEFEEDVENSIPAEASEIKEFIPLKATTEDIADAKDVIRKAAEEVNGKKVEKYEFEKLEKPEE